MLKSLYSKMLAWLLLNLLLIALVGGGFVFFVLFSNTYGLVPASLFSSTFCVHVSPSTMAQKLSSCDGICRLPSRSAIRFSSSIQP